MKSKWQKSIFDSIIHFSVWFLAWIIVLLIFRDSSSKFAYSILSAWWCSLYIGFIREIGLRALLPLFFLHVCVLFICLTLGIGWFLGGHDSPTLSEITFGHFILSTVGGYIILGSPILINSVVLYMLRKQKKF